MALLKGGVARRAEEASLAQAEEERGTRDRRGALASPTRFAALAHILETVFSRRFSVLLKLRWAVLAIIKAHRFLS